MGSQTIKLYKIARPTSDTRRQLLTTAANASEGRAHVDTLNYLPASGATLKKQVKLQSQFAFLIHSFLRHFFERLRG